jgi:hypothetical protein
MNIVAEKYQGTTQFLLLLNLQQAGSMLILRVLGVIPRKLIDVRRMVLLIRAC